MGATAGAIRAGRAFVELFTDDSKLVQGLRQGEAKLKAWGAAVTSAGSKLFALGASVVTPLAASAKIFADMGSQLNDMSSRTGASVEALSTLGFAAKQSGSDMEGLETSLRKMQKNIEAAATGSQEAQHALARLGLTADDLKGMKPEDQFRVLGDVISQIANPTERAAAAMAIFGKSGTQLLPMFEGGIAGLTAMEDKARALGLEMSGKDAAAADSLGDALDALWDTVKMGVFSVGSALAPMLEGLIETTTAIVVSASNWVKENRELVVSIFTVAAGVAAAGAALVGLGTVLSTAGTALGALAALLGAILSPVGLTIAAIAALGYAFVKYTETGKQALSWLIAKFEELKADAIDTFGGISDALSAGDIGLAMKILWLTLQMEWQKGTGFLLEKWSEFKVGFQQTAVDAFYGVLEIANDVWASMRTAWANFINWFVTKWRTAQNAVAKATVDVMAYFDSSIDADDAKKQLDDDLAREQQDRDTAHERNKRDIEKDRQARQDDLAGQNLGANAGLSDASRADLDARAKALADTIDERNKALAEAKAKRKEGKGPGGGPVDVDEFTGGLPAAKATAGVGFEDVRSKEGFKPVAAALRQGANDPQKQSAAALKQMADLQKRQFIEEKKTREALEKLGTVSFPGGTS